MMENKKSDRRKFLKQLSALGILGVVCAAGIVGSPYLRAHETRLRPPGAVDEDDFLALCIKCGQCLQVCPYHSIKLSEMAKGHGVGTPYIDPRERGCYLCTLLPCVLACPSGALDHHLEDVRNVRMGIAVVERLNDCIATKNGKVPREAIDRIYAHPHEFEQEEEVLVKLEKFHNQPCTICADMCPLPNKEQAIGMKERSDGTFEPEIKEACVGCGACVELCPTNVLRIEPRLTYEDYYIKGERHA